MPALVPLEETAGIGAGTAKLFEVCEVGVVESMPLPPAFKENACRALFTPDQLAEPQ